MPRFTYTGEPGLYYPYLAGGVTPEPGSEYELEAAPEDGRWAPAKAATAATTDDTSKGK